jgi:molybdenum cofactor biosynthesis enzyme MoaA
LNNIYLSVEVTGGLGFQSLSVQTNSTKQTSARSKLPYPITIPWDTTQPAKPTKLITGIPQFTHLIHSSKTARKAKTRKTKINFPLLPGGNNDRFASGTQFFAKHF